MLPDKYNINTSFQIKALFDDHIDLLNYLLGRLSLGASKLIGLIPRHYLELIILGKLGIVIQIKLKLSLNIPSINVSVGHH